MNKTELIAVVAEEQKLLKRSRISFTSISRHSF